MQFRTCSARLVLLLVFLVAGATELRGQTYQGGLRGAVRDAQGGVMPGATVTLTNEGTNAARSMVTNDVGEYSFPNVQPGKYSVRAEVQGFNTYQHSGIEIGVQRFHVIDIRLEVGRVTESIIVTGESPILETATGSRSASLESFELETLPSPSRNPYFMSITTPNVVPTAPHNWTRMQDQSGSSALSIAGGPRSGNNYTIDGVPITDTLNRAVIIPSIEAVEEVNIQVSTYDAEMGRTGGGVFNTFHKRGSNLWSGSAGLQNRPRWGLGQLYFAKEAEEPKPDGYYWLWAGSFGGPIIPDKTFFWVATEGYRTNVSRNTVLTLPTAAEARGDFSQSGRIIYDPLSTRPDPNNAGQFIRNPFPGNVIPADRLNPVGLNLAAFLAERGSGQISASADVVNAADQASFNINHQFSDKYSLSGTYMYYDSNEPLPLYRGGPSDPNLGELFRQVHVLALNNTVIPSDDTVFTLRYGYMSFISNWSKEEYDPAQLGFSQNYLNQITVNTFPRVSIDGYERLGGSAGYEWQNYSHAVNTTVSKFIGSHTLKLGADFRRLSVNLFDPNRAAGNFDFDRGFTGGPDPNSPNPDSGDSLASLVIGFPSRGYVPVNTRRQLFINYYGAFIQDDWRITPELVLNFGLRVEHETGIREINNRQTVGFDREREWPIQPIEGMTLRGGLMYAGVDGYPEYQGDPTPVKWGPRAGVAWSLNEKTVLRGGYGVFWVPYQPTFEEARGYSAETEYFASNDGGLTPAGSITNPFPDGLEQPMGNSLGLMTGAGGDVSFADQFRKSAYVQQFSAELQRELSGGVVVSAGYLGSRSDRLGLGGTSSYPVNINQLDPKYFELGTALQEPVANPFFGNPIFGNFSQRPTIPRGQLLRPYPQFDGLYAEQMGEGIRRYHSLVLRVKKRFRGGWGGRINYTFSRNDDNIFGESNAFSNRRGFALNNYDLDAEYSRSISDTPHRLNISGIIELPFGRGRRWLDQGGVWRALFGNWSLSAAAFYQSGFPLGIYQTPNNTGLFGDLQRPDLLAGVDPGHAGSTVDNLDTYLNPDAWNLAEPFTFGNAPRTEMRVRSPFRQNWDIAFQKTEPVGTGNLTVRFEIINLFDHPDFAAPVTRFGSRNFGQILNVSGFPRLLQIMIRFNW